MEPVVSSFDDFIGVMLLHRNQLMASTEVYNIKPRFVLIKELWKQKKNPNYYFFLFETMFQNLPTTTENKTKILLQGSQFRPIFEPEP